MEGVFLETKRLILRKMSMEDFSILSTMLQDREVMYAWGYTFTDEQVYSWIGRMNENYERYGYAYFLAWDKQLHEVIGQIGLLPEEIEGKKYIGIGYILCKKHWGKGYATEGAGACMEYAFRVLGASIVIADIRPENLSSRAVAERIGMKMVGKYDKIVNGREMTHLIYRATN